MTAFIDAVRDLWKEAAQSAPAGREWRGIALSTQGAVRLRAAIREPDGRIALLIECPIAEASPAHIRIRAEGISVADQRRPEEGVVRLAIVLERDEHRNIFEVLITDVASVAIRAVGPREAMRVAASRLEAWQACLRNRHGRMSHEEMIGLRGELEVLRKCGDAIGYIEAVEAWLGPLDGIQDFSMSGTAIEVKAALGATQIFRVSSANQLETRTLNRLAIARVRFREDAAGETLSEVVAQLRQTMAATAPAALIRFDDRILRVGYLENDPEQGPRVLVDEIYGYAVESDFPRIVTADLPAGVIDVGYSVDERSARPFRFEAHVFDAYFSAMAEKDT